MTAKEFVKTHYPKARVQHYKTTIFFDTKGYYLCWADHTGSNRLSEGTSESNAWVNAKNNIKANESNND